MNCHPERVRMILDIADSNWHNSIVFGCVGNVQALCVGFGLNDSFLVAGRGPGETRRVSPAPLKMADGIVCVPSVLFLCRPIVT